MESWRGGRVLLAAKSDHLAMPAFLKKSKPEHMTFTSMRKLGSHVHRVAGATGESGEQVMDHKTRDVFLEHHFGV